MSVIDRRKWFLLDCNRHRKGIFGVIDRGKGVLDELYRQRKGISW